MINFKECGCKGPKGNLSFASLYSFGRVALGTLGLIPDFSQVSQL